MAPSPVFFGFIGLPINRPLLSLFLTFWDFSSVGDLAGTFLPFCPTLPRIVGFFLEAATLMFSATRRASTFPFFSGIFRRCSVREVPCATPKEFLDDFCGSVFLRGRPSIFVLITLLCFEFLVGFLSHVLTPFSATRFWTAVECSCRILAYGCRNEAYKYSICIYSLRGSQL